MTESKAREFWICQGKERGQDFVCTGNETRQFSGIHVIEKSYADKLQAELAKKDELLRECNQFLNYHLITCRFNYVDDNCTCGLLELKDKLREVKSET